MDRFDRNAKNLANSLIVLAIKILKSHGGKLVSLTGIRSTKFLEDGPQCAAQLLVEDLLHNRGAGIRQVLGER